MTPLHIAAVLVTAGLGFAVAGASAQGAAKSRQEIVAETAAANAAGQIQHGEGPRNAWMEAWTGKWSSTRTREEVRAETREANQAGLIQHGELTERRGIAR